MRILAQAMSAYQWFRWILLFGTICGLLLFYRLYESTEGDPIAWLLNLSELNVSVEDGIDPAAVEVFHRGASTTQVFGAITNDIPEHYGQNGFCVSVGDRRGGFGHFKENNWYDHDYHIRIYRDADEIHAAMVIAGPHPDRDTFRLEPRGRCSDGF